MSFLLTLLLMNSIPAQAQSEAARYRDFLEHQEENRNYDREREAGLKDYLREQADWEEQRKKDRDADKSRKRQESPKENGPEYKADRKEKYEDYLEFEKNRKAYVKEKKAQEPRTAQEEKKRNAWALEEYGLDKERPRFDIAKRNIYGGRSGSGSAGGGFGPSSAGDANSGFAPSFPAPPPPFDDFNDNFVPPPFPPADGFEPPPEGFVPPPPIQSETRIDGEPGDFVPPPPPPPPIPAPGDF